MAETPLASDLHFRTDHLQADLKGRGVRGGAVTLGAQAVKFVLQVGSPAVLARLLTPQDYGLIARVAVFAGFVGLFKDLDLSLGFARRIVDELHVARPMCPTFGMPYSLAGQIETFVLADPAGPGHVRRGFALSGWDQDAAAKLLTAIARGYPPNRAIDLLLAGDRADLAAPLAAGNPDAIRHLAAQFDRAGVHAEARQLLEAACARPNDVLAAQLAAEKDPARAVSCTAAPSLKTMTTSPPASPSPAPWPRQARALAIHEAKICLRRRGKADRRTKHPSAGDHRRLTDGRNESPFAPSAMYSRCRRPS